MLQKLFFALGSLLTLFGLIPPLGYGILHMGVLVLLAAGGALLLAWRLWDRMSRGARRGFLALCSLGLVYAVGMSAWMAAAAFLHSPPREEPVAAVVLGAKVNGDQPSRMLRLRLDAAVSYLERQPQALCVVSGGQGADELYPEAQVMASYLAARGVDPARILEEDRSTNTRENLAYSAGLLGEAGDGEGVRVAIVTDSFHQLRASIFGRSLGLECYAVPSMSPWGLFPSYWAREWLAIPVALFQTK